MNEKNNESSVHLFTCSIFIYTKDILQAPGWGGEVIWLCYLQLELFQIKTAF